MAFPGIIGLKGLRFNLHHCHYFASAIQYIKPYFVMCRFSVAQSFSIWVKAGGIYLPLINSNC